MEENKQQYQGTTASDTGPTPDTNPTGGPETGGTKTGNSRQAQNTQEVLDELSRLGVKLAEVVQTAWESDERKRLEKDVKAGVVSLVNGLEEGLRRVGKSEQAKEVLNKAEDVADSIGERIRSSQTSHDMASGLAKGLRILAEQIDKLATELQRKSAATETDAPPPTTPASTDAQDIPIHKV